VPPSLSRIGARLDGLGWRRVSLKLAKANKRISVLFDRKDPVSVAGSLESFSTGFAKRGETFESLWKTDN
jgi:hypothetical protein